MKKIVTLSSIALACTLSTGSIAMETNPAALQADFVLPTLTKESLMQLAHNYETHYASKDPQELRLALFGVVSSLAATPLDKRDPIIEANAHAVYKDLSPLYPSANVRDTKFLYGIMHALQRPAQEDRHPSREFYTPVELLRTVMKTNDQEQLHYQMTAEELAREEHKLSTHIAALQTQLTATRAKKQSQQHELTLIVQANHSLKAHIACLGVALQSRRDTLKKIVIDTIDQFIDLKKKLADAAVAHEKTNYTEQLKPLPETIDTTITSLWYCVHYLQRIKSPDGTFSTGDALKWKLGSVNPEELGINNYADYLKYKAQ